jgi:hypothetical protein
MLLAEDHRIVFVTVHAESMFVEAGLEAGTLGYVPPSAAAAPGASSRPPGEPSHEQAPYLKRRHPRVDICKKATYKNRT